MKAHFVADLYTDVERQILDQSPHLGHDEVHVGIDNVNLDFNLYLSTANYSSSELVFLSKSRK